MEKARVRSLSAQAVPRALSTPSSQDALPFIFLFLRGIRIRIRIRMCFSRKGGDRDGPASQEGEASAPNGRTGTADNPDAISDSTSEGVGAPGEYEGRRPAPQPQRQHARGDSYPIDQLADIASRHLPPPPAADADADADGMAVSANGGGGAGSGFCHDATGSASDGGGEGPPPFEGGEDEGEEEVERLQGGGDGGGDGGKHRVGGNGGVEDEGARRGGRGEGDVGGDSDETSDENGY